MIKIGIIGCGKVAQVRHIPEYHNNDNSMIIGFYDRDFSRALEMAERYGGIAYKTYEELLENEEIHGVSVCAPNHVHSKITIDALKAGKHVLCEKPMATTISECEAMVNTAEEMGKKLLIGHNQRLTPAHKKARELIKGGLIGKIITFRTTFGHSGPENWSINKGDNLWFFDKGAASLGVMADLGVHKTDLIQFLMGEAIIETTAKLTTLDKKYSNGSAIEVDDNAFCIYKLQSGIMGTLTVSWTHYGPEDNSTILYGEKGIMKIYDDPRYSIKVLLRNGEEMNYDLESIQTNDNQTKSQVIDTFIESILEDKETELSGKYALSTMKVIFAAVESSETGRTVSLNEEKR